MLSNETFDYFKKYFEEHKLAQILLCIITLLIAFTTTRFLIEWPQQSEVSLVEVAFKQASAKRTNEEKAKIWLEAAREIDTNNVSECEQLAEWG